MQVKFVYEDHRVKVKVMGAKAWNLISTPSVTDTAESHGNCSNCKSTSVTQGMKLRAAVPKDVIYACPAACLQ